MPSQNDWRDPEAGVGRDACRLIRESRHPRITITAFVWLAFYVLAVTYAVISYRNAEPVITTEATGPLRGESR
jgi:steroid 5-alpha reductase family enzyme